MKIIVIMKVIMKYNDNEIMKIMKKKIIIIMMA